MHTFLSFLYSRLPVFSVRQTGWLTVRCLLAASLMVFAASAAKAGAWLDVSVGQAKAEAATLLKAGKVSDAYRMYMALLRETPEDPEINLGLAEAATAVGETEQAVLALERLVDMYPRDAGLRLALARAHMRVGDAAAARRELELAQRLDPSLSEELVDKAMARLESESSVWQVAGRISGGVLYDSNVNLGPQSASIQLGFWPLQLDSAATSKESWGGYGLATLSVARRLGMDSPWWIVGDTSLYRKGYFSDLPVSRELAWGRAAVGLRRISPSTLLELRLKTEFADYISDAQQSKGNGPELLFVWGVRPDVQLITQAMLDRRDYQTMIGRQGWFWSVGEYVRVLFGAAGHDLTLGGRYFQSDVVTTAYTYEGYEGTARLTFKLPGGVDCSPFVTLRREDYTGPATALELDRRQDKSVRTGVSVTVQLTDHLSLDTSYQFTSNHSSSPLYLYDQQLITMGMTWRF